MTYYKIEKHNGLFFVKVKDNQEIGEEIFDFCQGLSRISDISFMFSGRITTSFYDEVFEFLQKLNLDFSKNQTYKGRSGRNRRVDFDVKTSYMNSLIYGLTVTQTNNMNQRSDVVCSSWMDLEYLLNREKPTQFISLINDQYSKPSQGNINLLRDSSEVVYWSNKNKLKRILLMADS